MSQLGVKVEIIPAIHDHIAPIAEHMREADRQEVWAASRSTPQEALDYSLKKSSFAYTGIVDDVPVVMFGVGDINVLGGMGAPWLLGTDAVAHHARLFLRQSLLWRDAIRARYCRLSNFVDSRNRVSIRWLKWLGFELKEPVIMNGVVFYLFEMSGSEQEAVSGLPRTGNVKNV